MAKMPFTYAKDYLKLPVECIDFFDYAPKTSYYDVVTMWDVLEHIDNCDIAVEKCATMLKQGGYIVNSSSKLIVILQISKKKSWQAMDLIMSIIFQRHYTFLENNGFEVVKIKAP